LFRSRVEPFDRAHGFGVQPGALIGQVVTGDAGHSGVAQTHRLHTFGDPAGLVAVDLTGFAGLDQAERAVAGAYFTADQEGGLPVLPALVDVGTARLLADRVQILPPDQALQLGVVRPHLG